MDWPDLTKVISDVVVGLAAAVTAGMAVFGVRSWSRELHGRARFEAAKSLARATYRLRESLHVARSPLVRAHEFPEGYVRGGGADKEAEAYAHIFTQRWESVWTALQEFDAQTLEAEALWGSSIRTKTDELRAVVRKLNAAVEAFISNEKSGGENFSSARAFGIQIRAEVFASKFDAGNEASNNLNAAVASIESELRAHLKRTS